MRPWKTLGAAASGAGVGVVLLAVGFAPPFAVGWGVVIAGLSLLVQLGDAGDPSSGAPRVDVLPESRTSEVSRLAWALNPNTGHAGERVTRRIRAILRHRLERLAIDPDDPADRLRMSTALGEDIWSGLNGESTTVADIERALTAIDRLSPTKEEQ